MDGKIVIVKKKIEDVNKISSSSSLSSSSDSNVILNNTVISSSRLNNTVISSSSEDENDSDYVASKSSNNISSGSDSSDLSSNEYYEIEKLLDKRINPITGVTEYLVKWEGYSSDENTWEPEPNLVEDDNEDLITEWRQSQAMKSPELRAAKNTLLSKLRARHLTPTLGRVLSGDDFVLPETNGWEDVLNGKDDNEPVVDQQQIEKMSAQEGNNNKKKKINMVETQQKVFRLNKIDIDGNGEQKNVLLKEGTAMVKQNNNSHNTSSQDSDEDEDDDDLRIVFQGEQQEDVFPHSTYQDEDEGNVLPLPGSNIKHARRLQPKDFCTPRDDPSPRALNVMGMLSQDSINSSNDNVVVSSKKTTTTMASSNNNQSMKKKMSRSPLSARYISKFSPSKSNPTVKRKYNNGLMDSASKNKKQKTLLFSQSSSRFIMKDKSPLRDQGKMRNSFLGMRNKKNTSSSSAKKSSYSKALFGRRR